MVRHLPKGAADKITIGNARSVRKKYLAKNDMSSSRVERVCSFVSYKFVGAAVFVVKKGLSCLAKCER